MNDVHPTRATARSSRGMIATPHAAATVAGHDVLRRGGNAVDAAIAANAVLAVVYPASCGIGGDAFWMIYEPKTSQTVCWNGSGAAARGLDAASLRERGMREMPKRGAFPVTVPGAVRSWDDVARAHGTRGLDELLAPAIELARSGFIVGDIVGAYAALNAGLLLECTATRALFAPQRPIAAGDHLRNVDLATTLEKIAHGGADAFYQGEIAERIVATLRLGGNPMTLDDLLAQRTVSTSPWRVAWQGGEVLAHPPNSHGSTALLALAATEAFDDGDDALAAHCFIEAFKAAFTIRDTRFGDPAFVSVDETEITGAPVVARVRDSIDTENVTGRFTRPGEADTIGIVCVDEDGRAVSLIESLYMNFGSGLVAEGTGIVLHNRGAYFNLIEGHPNELRGGHRPVHTLSPGMYLRDGKPACVYGTMGGDGQPQIHAQLLHAMYRRGDDVQVAIDRPRWIAGRPHIAGRDDAMTDTVLVESRMPRDIVDGLRRRHHVVEEVKAFDSTMGHAHAIVIDHKRGTLAGGADPRADSLALGW